MTAEVSQVLAEITDALARGHVSLAEVARLRERELDAIYGVALLRFDVGHDEVAATILAGLVALSPYSARYWRAYGVALHRLGAWPEARRAYDAALALEDGHPATLYYRGEVLAHLCELERAIVDLDRAALASEDEAIARGAHELARALRARAEDATTARAAAAPVPPSDDEPTLTFVLRDARPLPLDDGGAATEEITKTAVVPRRDPAREREITHTAVVVRNLGGFS